MSQEQAIACEYCGRDDFKSDRGLQQHLSRSKRCNDAHKASISCNPSQRDAETLAWTQKILADNAKRAALAKLSLFEVQHDMDALGSTYQLAAVFDEEAENEEEDPFIGADDESDQAPVQNEDNDEEDDEDADHFAVNNEGEMESDGESAGTNHPNDCDLQPSTAGRDDFVAFCRKNTFFAPLTDAEVRGIRLLDILRQKKAPINAYDSLMEWHLRDNGVLSHDQTLKDAGQKQFVGRKPLLARLAARYNLVGKGPKEKVVRLPSSKEVVKIPVFDAEDKVVELLTNPRLEPEDFDFFDDDPLAPPPNDPEDVGNMNTGKGFRDTYAELIHEANQQLLGTPFYIDGAVTGQFSDLPVTAVKFSLTCFTQKARLKPHMWATLGYLPEIKVAESRGKKLFVESSHLEAEDLDMFDGEGEEVDIDADAGGEDGLTEIKAQDFHFMLGVILAPMIDLQRSGMIWDLMHKFQLYKNVHFELYVPICRCDTAEADVLCGKYASRTRNVQQICRQCYVPTMESSRHDANYPAKTQKKIQKLVEQGKVDELQAISQHYLQNAWYKCRFNQGNDRGIHGACPSEMLHAIQLGIFKYTRDIFFESIGESAQVAHDINGLARVYGKLLSHQSDRSLPNTNFSKGIKDGKLMAKDYRGVLLVMAAVIRSTKGREMLGTKRNFRQETLIDDWQLLVELLLEWEAYLCLPEMKLKHVKRLDKKHRYIMYVMKKVANRTKGMGLNIMKFHAIVHLMDDIIHHGVPLEADTAGNESHHKIAKVAARLTQRNEAHFIYQVAVRMYEFLILDLAIHEIENGRRISDYFDIFSDESIAEMDISSENSNEMTEASGKEELIVTDDAKITVFFDEEQQAPGFELQSKSKFVEKTQMNTELLEFLLGLQDLLSDYLPTKSLDIFTRHKRGDNIFHGHPNYRGQGPWRDWAVVQWEGYGELPCHICCFVVLDSVPASRNGFEYGGVRLKNATYAVVESVELEEDEEELGKSDLFVPLIKEVAGVDDLGNVLGRKFYLAETEAIVRPCAVIPDIGGDRNRYFLVKGREEWHKEFIAWVERPHHDDDMNEEEEEND